MLNITYSIILNCIYILFSYSTIFSAVSPFSILHFPTLFVSFAPLHFQLNVSQQQWSQLEQKKISSKFTENDFHKT